MSHTYQQVIYLERCTVYQLFAKTLTKNDIDEDILIEFDNSLFSQDFMNGHTALICSTLFADIPSNSITRIVSTNSDDYIHIFTTNLDSNSNYFNGGDLVAAVVLYRHSNSPVFNVALIKHDGVEYVCVAIDIKYTLSTVIAMYENMQTSGIVRLDQTLTQDYDIAMSDVYRIISLV